MARIVQVINCALATFSESRSPSLDRLLSLLASLTPHDIGLDDKLLEGPSRSTFFSPSKPTAAVVQIQQNSLVTIGAFILGADQKIPLHDHPGMYGLIKCIHGRLQIKSYTALEPSGEPIVVPREIVRKLPSRSMYENLIPCKFEQCIQVSSSASDAICQVTPDFGNIHEVCAIDGKSAAFVDVISPPYDSEIGCNYFEVIGTCHDAAMKQDITWLLRLAREPSSYWTVSAPYKGPAIQISRSS